MNNIHSTAIISSDATLGDNISIGPYAVIGSVTIADNVVIHSHAVITDGVTLEENVEVFPGALIGKEPKGAGATSKQPVFERNIHIGKNCSIGPHAVIYYDVQIGEGTLLGDGASIREQCRIGSKCIIGRYVTINYNTVVEDRSKIMDLTNLTGNMHVEKDAFVGMLVATTNDNVIRKGYGDHIVGPTIGEGAIVGSGSTILPAVKIGRFSTVAAGSVVTKDVEENTTVMGPAATPRKK